MEKWPFARLANWSLEQSRRVYIHTNRVAKGNKKDAKSFEKSVRIKKKKEWGKTYLIYYIDDDGLGG